MAKGDVGAILAALPLIVIVAGVGGAVGCSIIGYPTKGGLAAGLAGTVLIEVELLLKADVVSDLKLKGLLDL